MLGNSSWDVNVGEVEPGIVEQLIRVLADPGFDVVAGDVVPLDAVVVEVVEDGDAGLVGAVLAELPVVGLGRLAAASGRPVAVPPLRRVGGSDATHGARPEPAVYNMRLKIRSVAAVKVALASAGPDVAHAALLHVLVHKLRLLRGLQGHQVLTVLPADVPGVQPVSLVGLGGLVHPREEVVLVVPEGGGVGDSVGAGLRLWLDQLSLRVRHGHRQGDT